MSCFCLCDRLGPFPAQLALLFFRFVSMMAIVYLFSIFIWIHCSQDYRKYWKQKCRYTPRIQNKPISDAHINLYNNVCLEITRYRDLSWKIVAFSWTISYAIYNFYCQPGAGFMGFQKTAFIVLVYFVAIAATIFLIWVEVSANRNKFLRRRLGRWLGIEARLNFTKSGENPLRKGTLFSVGLFILLIWFPVATLHFTLK